MLDLFQNETANGNGPTEGIKRIRVRFKLSQYGIKGQSNDHNPGQPSQQDQPSGKVPSFMASSVTPLLIAARGHSTRGRRPVDLQNHPLKSFLAASHRPCRPSGPFNTRNRLSTFTRAGAASAYTWDANGNRLSSIETTRADTDLDGAFDAEDFSATTAQSLTIAEGSNRLLGFTQTLTNVRGTRALSTTSAQVAYSMAAAGNLTSDGLRSFNHDASGRLAQVRIGLGSEEAATVYLHNALGQRVFKSEPQATQYAPDEQELGEGFINWLKKNFGWLFAKAQANATLGQSYVYADAPLPGWALLGEYGNGGSKSAGRLEIVWLPTENGSAIPIGLYRNGRLHAIHPDHLGTPRLITDEANKPVWQWPYSAFGANKPSGILKATPKPKQAYTNEPVLLKATNPALTFNLRYPGQYFDEESNLNYNYFRSYQPAQGRYSQADPIGLDGGLNRFAYVEGSPLGAQDPEGLVKLHGNWCGPNFSGGFSKPFDQLDDAEKKAVLPPVDKLDSCCRTHDLTYASCRKAYPCDAKARQQCFEAADRTLSSCAAGSGAGYGANLLLFGNPKFRISDYMRDSKPAAEPNDPSCSCTN